MKTIAKNLIMLFLILIALSCAKKEKIMVDSEFRYDLEDISHEFKGFGAQIWAFTRHENHPDLGKWREKVLKELNIKYVRIANSRASWEEVAETKAMTDELGIKWVFVIWVGPSQFSNENRMLEDVEGFAEYWKDLIQEQYDHDINIEYVELMNEPDSRGAWSTGIIPEQYNELVKILRHKLDSADLNMVGIVGSGPASMWRFPDYAKALDAEGVSSLAAFSTHAWGTDGSRTDTIADPGQYTFNTTVKNFINPCNEKSPSKPKFVTEYSTHETTFENHTYPHGDRYGEWNPDFVEPNYSVTNTMGYALRCYTNTLALLNAGAEAPFFWQANDEPTESNPPGYEGSKRKAWGLVDLDGNEKPVFQALKTIYPKIPVGAKVLLPPDHSGEVLYTGAFSTEDKIIIGISNESDAENIARINLASENKLGFNSALQFKKSFHGDPAKGEPDKGETSEVKLKLKKSNSDGYYIDVNMLPYSSMTVIIDIK